MLKEFGVLLVEELNRKMKDDGGTLDGQIHTLDDFFINWTWGRKTPALVVDPHHALVAADSLIILFSCS